MQNSYNRSIIDLKSLFDNFRFYVRQILVSYSIVFVEYLVGDSKFLHKYLTLFTP